MKRQTEERAKEETAAEAERTLARRTGQGEGASVKLESGAWRAHGGRPARERLLSSAKSLSAFLEFEASLRMGLSCVADTDLGGTLYFRARKKRYSAVLKSMVSDHFEKCIGFLMIWTQR